MAPQEIDFISLVLGFSSAALGYLGFTVTGQQQAISKKDLNLAAQNIEIIALLKEKTKGNLTEEESRLIEQVITDLRVKYVEATKIGVQ